MKQSRIAHLYLFTILITVIGGAIAGVYGTLAGLLPSLGILLRLVASRSSMLMSQHRDRRSLPVLQPAHVRVTASSRRQSRL